MILHKKRNLAEALLLFILIISVLTTTGCANSASNDFYDEPTVEEELEYEESRPTNFIKVKYKEDSVDLADPRFEYLDTTGSEFIFGAWYDDDEQYMIINLNGTYYHYCGMPGSVWDDFRNAETFGGFYNKWIKGNYACN